MAYSTDKDCPEPALLLAISHTLYALFTARFIFEGMRQSMVSLQKLEAQYRALIAQMDESDAAIARQDLEAVEACVFDIDRTLFELAQASAQLEGRAIVPGEESAWKSLAEAMRQAFTRSEQNREAIQSWIGSTQGALVQMSRGGKALNGYAASGAVDDAEFLNARG